MSETKNRPKSANNNGAAATKNGNAVAASAVPGSPIAGRITLKMATTNSPVADNLVSTLVYKRTKLHACHFRFSSVYLTQQPLKYAAMTETELNRK